MYLGIHADVHVMATGHMYIMIYDPSVVPPYLWVA